MVFQWVLSSAGLEVGGSEYIQGATVNRIEATDNTVMSITEGRLEDEDHYCIT